jgi:hypothetical protein
MIASRGGARDRHGRGTGCAGREAAPANDADGEVVWSGRAVSSEKNQRSERVRRIMLPAADHAGNRRTEDGRQPEQPELRDVCSAGKQRRAGASRRIDRGVGDRDQEEMNKRQAKPDGYPGKSDRRAFRGGADDDVQEEEGRDDFTQEARQQTVFSGAEIAVAVGRKPFGNPSGFARGDHIEYRGRRDGAGHLCENVGKYVGALEAASGPEPNGNGTIEMPAGDVADRISHGQYG